MAAPLSQKFLEVKERAENDLFFFISLVAPQECLGACHREVLEWWDRPGAKNFQLLLFPRDHRKSGLVAYRVAQALAKDPTLRILYISATSGLAEKQLLFIKNILTSNTFSRYWPEHVNKEEGKRARWTNSEIALDHPLRKKENIRDPSIFTAGLTTSITGLHCDIAVLDDVVVYENAYTDEGRRRVQSQYSLLSSIEGADAKEWVVGTRYHPKDLYNSILEMKEVIYDTNGEQVGEEPIYEVMQKAVEDFGDGTGNFLWPRQQRGDGKWFGFDQRILATKKGKYLDKTQFRAQYYNDPQNPEDRPVDYTHFRYYDRKQLENIDGHWCLRGKRLNLTASIDFAWSMSKNADYTSLLLLGTDCDNNHYVLDLERFRTGEVQEYFKMILGMFNKWSFRKLICDGTAAQAMIVKSLREDYINYNNLPIRVEHVHRTKHQGTKEERVNSALIPRYHNGQIYHYKGGAIHHLEEELVSTNPAHDDCKDALATAIEYAVKPPSGRIRKDTNNIIFHSRFGGVVGKAA